MEVLLSNQSAEEVDLAYLERTALQVMKAERLPDSAELSVVLVGRAKMRDLNRKLRAVDSPTDVLALPLYVGRQEIEADTSAAILLLGDVIICPQEAEEAALEFGVETPEEMSRLLIHGILHLLGYDHEEPEQARFMEAREEELLSAWESELR